MYKVNVFFFPIPIICFPSTSIPLIFFGHVSVITYFGVKVKGIIFRRSCYCEVDISLVFALDCYWKSLFIYIFFI